MANGMETELRIPFSSAGEAEIVYNSLRVEVEPARSKVGFTDIQSRLQRFWLFFQKIKCPVFDFLSRFARVWRKSLQKMTQKIILSYYFDMSIKKRRIWCRVLIHWKTSKEIYMKKVIGLRTFVHSTVLKGEKVHNSYTFTLITFFVGIFYNFFIGFEMTPISKLVGKNFCGHISTFYKLWSRTRSKRPQKNEKSFFQTWIRINYIFQVWFRTSKLLKSFNPNTEITHDALLFGVAQGIFWLSTERLLRSTGTLHLKEGGEGSLCSCTL